MTNVIRTVKLTKDYPLGSHTVRALREVSFDVAQGDYVAIMGQSGSGKSTLLNLLGCLDRPTAGDYFVGQRNVAHLDDDELSEIRSRYLGFIFQSYNLIAQLSVVDNVHLPLFYQGLADRQTRQRAVAAAEQVGLGDRLDHRPNQLSGGQQQRVAIARALINEPYVILADEPTGNLDSATSEEILGLLDSLNRSGKTVIMVTHEADVARHARRIVRMRDGVIVSDETT